MILYSRLIILSSHLPCHCSSFLVVSRRRSSFLSSFVAHRRCKHLHPAEHGCSCFDNTWRVKTLVINQPSTWLQFSFSLQGHCLPLASGLHPTLSSTPPPPRRSSVLLRLLQSQNPQLECQLLFQSLPHRIAIITKSPKLFATQLPTVLKQITVLVQEWDGAKRLSRLPKIPLLAQQAGGHNLRIQEV